MSEFEIRTGNIDDARMLSKIGADTFWATYGENDNAEQDDIRKYIAKAYDLNLIREELSDESFLYLVAEKEGEAVGYARLRIGSRTEDLTARHPLEISRIYVLKQFQGTGYGRKLIERCLEEAARLDCDALWLSVWRHNHNAIGFYEKMGFKVEGKTVFDLAGTLHEDLMMAKMVDGES